MDEYGFCAAAGAGLQMFEQCARQSGRTMRMIERARSGDQIVVATAKESRRLSGLLRDADKTNVRVIVATLDMTITGRIPRAAGRTFFDHEWQRIHFEAALRSAARELESYQRDTSAKWPQTPDQAGMDAEVLLERWWP